MILGQKEYAKITSIRTQTHNCQLLNTPTRWHFIHRRFVWGVQTHGAAVVHWMALAAHDQKVNGSMVWIPSGLLVVSGRASDHNLFCAPPNQSQDPLRKSPIQSFSQGMETLNGHESMWRVGVLSHWFYSIPGQCLTSALSYFSVIIFLLPVLSR